MEGVSFERNMNSRTFSDRREEGRVSPDLSFPKLGAARDQETEESKQYAKKESRSVKV